MNQHHSVDKLALSSVFSAFIETMEESGDLFEIITIEYYNERATLTLCREINKKDLYTYFMTVNKIETNGTVDGPEFRRMLMNMIICGLPD